MTEQPICLLCRKPLNMCECRIDAFADIFGKPAPRDPVMRTVVHSSHDANGSPTE